MIPLSTRESLMAALEHDRVIEPAKKIKNAIQNLKDFGEGLLFHVNTNLLPINLPAFQSAAQIIKTRHKIILYQNFKNRN